MHPARNCTQPEIRQPRKDELGTISVVTQRAKLIREELRDWQRYQAPAIPAHPWYEKHAKGINQRVAEARKVGYRHSSESAVRCKPYKEEPIAIFKFKYRSEAFLRAQRLLETLGPEVIEDARNGAGVRETTPAPARNEVRVKQEDQPRDSPELEVVREQLSKNQEEMDALLKKDISSSNAARILSDVKRLLQRRKGLEEEQAGLLRRANDSGEPSRKRIKTEPCVSKKKDIVFIGLSDD